MDNFINHELSQYAVNHSTRPSQYCKDLQNYTLENVELSQMLIGEMEASFLGFLIRSLGVRNILEIGTYTGYSALAMAEQLPENGKLLTLDVNSRTAKIAQDFWAKSPDGHKIQQILGPGLESMDSVEKGSIDLIFIDADKNNYINYLKKGVDLLSPKGIIVLDNTLWSGRVLEENPLEEQTRSIKEVNDYIAKDPSLYSCLLPIRDGMLLVKPILE